MFLLFVAWLEFWLVIQLFWALPWWAAGLLIVVLLLYLLWYMDGREYTGDAQWSAFRRLALWKRLTPVTHVWAAKEAEFLEQEAVRLFDCVQCQSPWSLVWAIGLDATRFARTRRTVYYVVPPVCMWVPLVREVLLWTGAVTYSKKRPVETVVRSLLQAQRSVCWPTHEFAPVGPDDADISVDALRMAADEAAQYVIVSLHRERQRYFWPFYAKQREWRAKLRPTSLGSWPYCYGSRLCASKRPPALVMQVASLMRAADYGGSVERFQTAAQDLIKELRKLQQDLITTREGH